MTKSSSLTENPISQDQSQDQKSALSQNYEAFFPAAGATEIALASMLDDFHHLSSKEQSLLTFRLENLITNLRSFYEFFGIKLPHSKVVKVNDTKFLCMEEEGRLVIRVVQDKGLSTNQKK